MHKLTKEELPAIAPLFEGVQETMVWSCLQGLMGEAYAEEETPPACAQLLLGDFCFFGGDARAAGAAELAGHIPRWLLAVPPTQLGRPSSSRETRGGSSASSDTPLRRSHRPSIGRIWPGWPPFRQDTRSFPSAGSCMNS